MSELTAKNFFRNEKKKTGKLWILTASVGVFFSLVLSTFIFPIMFYDLKRKFPQK